MKSNKKDIKLEKAKKLNERLAKKYAKALIKKNLSLKELSEKEGQSVSYIYYRIMKYLPHVDIVLYNEIRKRFIEKRAAYKVTYKLKTVY